MTELTLYHHRGACSLAPLIALEEAQLAFQLSIVDLAGDRTAYRRVNPSGKVPALTIGGELLTENAAILYRVAQLAPEAGLWPADPAAQGQALSFMAWLGSTVHILRRQIRVPSRFTPDAAAHASLVEAGRPKMWDALVEMETRLGDAPWFGGDRFDVRDAYAMVFHNWGLTDGFPLDELNRLTAWSDRMLARPAVRRALLEDAGPMRSAAEALAA